MTAQLVVVTTRLEKNLKMKLKHIADCEGRTVTRQLRQVIIKHIKDYEKEHGTIEFDHSKQNKS